MAVRGQGHGDTATPATPGRDTVPKEPLPGGDGGVWLWESLIMLSPPLCCPGPRGLSLCPQVPPPC